MPLEPDDPRSFLAALFKAAVDAADPRNVLAAHLPEPHAVLLPDTLARAAASGMDATAFLDANDSYGFFDALGDLVVTGPTGTNVSDFRAIYVEERNS